MKHLQPRARLFFDFYRRSLFPIDGLYLVASYETNTAPCVFFR